MISTGKDLAEACEKLTKEYKTLYVLGCFGAPMTQMNKERYANAQVYNRKSERETAIAAASEDTFGFDCVGMIKGLLWGWNGQENSYYGGAEYGAEGVPDLNANQMIKACRDVSGTFAGIQPGEAVWIPDHIGIYVGNGLVAECTPRWKDGCQVTALLNLGTKEGYHPRKWEKHGKLPYLSYEKDVQPEMNVDNGYTLDDFVRDIQNVTGCKVDGIAGNQTLSKTVTISVQKNSRHMAVLPIQRRLQALGFYRSTLDGMAGSRFEEAVKAYQTANSFWADGEITAGNKTWKSLLHMEGFYE